MEQFWVQGGDQQRGPGARLWKVTLVATGVTQKVQHCCHEVVSGLGSSSPPMWCSLGPDVNRQGEKLLEKLGGVGGPIRPVL